MWFEAFLLLTDSFFTLSSRLPRPFITWAFFYFLSILPSLSRPSQYINITNLILIDSSLPVVFAIDNFFTLVKNK
jgi:hypothetical protein